MAECKLGNIKEEESMEHKEKNSPVMYEETKLKTVITFCGMVKEEGFQILLCIWSKRKNLKKGLL